MENHSVDHTWEAGDMIVMDNFRVMHARRAYTPPRRILTTLWK